MALIIFISIFLLLIIVTEMYFWIRRLLFRKNYKNLINAEKNMPLEKFLKDLFSLVNINRQVLRPIYLFSVVIGFVLLGSVLNDFLKLLFSGSFGIIVEVTKDLLFEFSCSKLFKLQQLRYDSLLRIYLSLVFIFPLIYLFFIMFYKRDKEQDIVFKLKEITNGRGLNEKELNLILERTDNLIDKYHAQKLEILRLVKIAFKILILPFTVVLFKEMNFEIALNFVLLAGSTIIGCAIAIYQDFDSFDTMKYIGTKNYFKYGYAKQLLLKMRSFTIPIEKE